MPLDEHAEPPAEPAPDTRAAAEPAPAERTPAEPTPAEPTATTADAERTRLAAADAGTAAWRDWGPYLAERAWGTVREDYSDDGDAWKFFPHDHARSRAYRWNEDGMAGFSDLGQNWCLALSLWNGTDPILKERMFGLTGEQGNHGEDVKEYWWYTDATPTHSWNSWRYHYPQKAFPYLDLEQTNAARGKHDDEYELLDTGVFDESRFWIVTVDYAKEGPDDLLMQITVENAGPEEATLRILPTFWFRNTWSWGGEHDKPTLTADGASVVADSPATGRLRLTGDGHPTLLVVDNETNTERLFGEPGPEYAKDGINDHVVHGAATVNPERVGTKAAFDYEVTVAPQGKTVVRMRLVAESAPSAPPAAEVRAATPAAQPTPPTALDIAAFGKMAFDTTAFDTTVARRHAEADAYWATVTPRDSTLDEAAVLRQAMAGLLWSKQFYHYNVSTWLDGDPGHFDANGDPTPPPPPTGRGDIRNGTWRAFDAHDVILMPDTWEYPWFAAWDLAFHCVTLAHIDPTFAKEQLILLLREWYMHPDGQLPAYEWNFSDVNPPTHAWAALQVFLIAGDDDFSFLKRVFHKLLMNFTWWVNTKDVNGDDLFSGGFMGLDNIAPLDRSKIPPSVGTIEQADSTAWMGNYALDLLEIALQLADVDDAYQDIATTFVEHFLAIAHAANTSGMWDDDDAFFYDLLHPVGAADIPLKVRSLVGLVPVVASLVYNDERIDAMPRFRERLDWVLKNKPEYADFVHLSETGGERTMLMALVPPERLVRMLENVFDEAGMLSPHGIRGISAFHRDHPFTVSLGGADYSVDYEPAESTTALFGGNSNWRGPVWFPLNALLIEGLRANDRHETADFTVEFPAGSGTRVTLGEAADLLATRLVKLFLPGPDGRRPADARYETLSADPLWKPYLFFYEYFDGDTGQGLGASHQTGWTAAVAHLLLSRGGVGRHRG